MVLALVVVLLVARPPSSPPVASAPAAARELPTTSASADVRETAEHVVRGLRATTVVLGREHACLLQSGTGAVYCWGKNDHAQLGQPLDAGISGAVRVQGLAAVRALGAGEAHTCALIAAGVVCWGNNWSGQIGRADLHDSAPPVLVPGTAGADGLVAGGAFSCAIHHGGRVSCWGSDEYGELATAALHGEASHPSAPLVRSVVPLVAPDLFRVTDLAAGAHHACAIRADRSALCWGHNGEGQLGFGRSAPFSQAPVVVKGFTVGVKAIVAGGAHACALRENGQIICWGSNRRGQLGAGEPGGRSLVPVVVKEVDDGIALSTGAGDHTCAIRRDRSAVCWGSNDHGELGTGKAGGAEGVPVRVASIWGPRAMAAGAGRTCAIDEAGDVTCWGRPW